MFWESNLEINANTKIGWLFITKKLKFALDETEIEQDSSSFLTWRRHCFNMSLSRF